MQNSRLTLDSPQFAGSLRVNRRASFLDEGNGRLIQDIVVSKPVFVDYTLPKGRPRMSRPSTPASPRAVYEVVSRTQIVRKVPAREMNRDFDATPNDVFDVPGHKRIKHPSFLLYTFAAALLAVGIFIAYSGIKGNRQIAAQANNIASAQSANDENLASTDIPTDEKPSPEAVRNYAVAPTLPRYLDIEKLGIHARAISLSVDKNNQLRAPRNGYDVGWYDASSRPGENGAMVIDAHSNVLGKSAVFAKLNKLVSGDKVKVTRGDGQEFVYVVKTVETVDDEDVNMAKLLVSADTAKPGLSLITCAGDVIPGTLHLDKRTLVRAVLE